jgi:hypothetical protein
MNISPKAQLPHKIRLTLRREHKAYNTVQRYLALINRYLRFHCDRHHRHMGVAEIETYLSYLAVRRNVSASTQNRALNALLFLIPPGTQYANRLSALFRASPAPKADPNGVSQGRNPPAATLRRSTLPSKNKAALFACQATEVDADCALY